MKSKESNELNELNESMESTYQSACASTGRAQNQRTMPMMAAAA